MIFGTSVRVRTAAPLNIQIKGTSINQTSSYKYLAYLDSTLALNVDFNSKYKKPGSRLQLLSKLRPNLNVKAAKIYTNIVIPVFTYCGTVNLDLSRTSLGKLCRIHKRAVGIITKINTVKLTPIMNYVKHHACEMSEHQSQGSYQHLLLTISNYYHTQIQQETNSIALPRVRTKAAQRDICMQENENLFLKRLRNFNF